MKIEHLYYFLVIANTKSINKAACKLYLSQQHLSRIVTNLENELHIQLLKRSPAGIELTEKGEVFSQFAEKIVNDYREMQTHFYLDALPTLDQQEVCGTCQIAFPFFFSLFLNDFIQKLNTTYPDIHIRCFEGAEQASLEELTQSNMLHVIVGTIEQEQELLNEKSKLTSYYIGETGASFCIHRSSALANKSVLTKKDVDTQLQTCYPKNNWNSNVLTTGNILFTSSNIYQHLDSVVHNKSICVVPNYIHSGINKTYPDIKLIPYERQFSIPMYIFHSSQLTLNTAEKAVIRFVAQYIQNLNQLDEPCLC